MGHSEAILQRFLYPSKEDKSVEMWRYCSDTDLSWYACSSGLQKTQEMNVEADSIVSIICQAVTSNAEKREFSRYTEHIYISNSGTIV